MPGCISLSGPNASRNWLACTPALQSLEVGGLDLLRQIGHMENLIEVVCKLVIQANKWSVQRVTASMPGILAWLHLLTILLPGVCSELAPLVERIGSFDLRRLTRWGLGFVDVSVCRSIVWMETRGMCTSGHADEPAPDFANSN